jgi:hypothetical protein
MPIEAGSGEPRPYVPLPRKVVGPKPVGRSARFETSRALSDAERYSLRPVIPNAAGMPAARPASARPSPWRLT